MIKTGIIIEPDDKRDVLTEFENGNLTEDKNYMLPLRELWDKTPDKKTLMWLEVFYAPAPYYNSIRNIISDDIVWEINNRPKKILKFMTPLEMLKLEIKIKGCSDSI